jgi:phosphoribosyl 1,2-cyclic phosphate phosphodiesterase
MRLTFLGTGTSFGVPQIGCGCPVCRSTDPRDKRTRSGALVETGNASILIDTPPELRLQLIAGGVSRVDAVLYTHEHADHTNGIDDLRMFSVRRRHPLPLYGPPETLERLRTNFRYIFDETVEAYEGTSKPSLELHPLEPGVPAEVAGVEVLPLAFQHGHIRVYGYRIGGRIRPT